MQSERDSIGRMIDATPEERFLDKIIYCPSGCWMWAGSTDRRGYGWLYNNIRMVHAHRWAYQHFIGPIPDGLVCDHIVCDTPGCVNPHHLQITTIKNNVNRSPNSNIRKTHCPKGHPYSGGNLVVKKDGRRGCRACIKRQDHLGWKRRNHGEY